MVRITEQLIRKKAEHNELIISTLEELSLHQEDIEQIEHIQNWCRDLKILLLQNNLIGKIENVFKFKKLQYLNLAMNNIEIIENLDQLESLQKLDLTLNFIWNLKSAQNLQANYNLRELILTGNYCCEYNGYRNFVIYTLPQLEQLDGVCIKRTDQIVANKTIAGCEKQIVQQQIQQQIKRDEQIVRVNKEIEKDAEENAGLTQEEINERFWKKTSENCPETRKQIATQNQKNKVVEVVTKQEKPQRKLFAECGRPYNLNEPKIDFTFDEFSDHFELDAHVYKYLETSLIEVDVQPNYVRITIKGKNFQLALSEEIRISDSTSKRSLTTGHLLITMPKLMCNKRATNECVIEMAIKNKKGNVSCDSGGSIKGLADYKNII